MPRRKKAEPDFTPVPVMIIESPEQIKAFTDPLRVHVLSILRERAATNQQISDELGEAHSKILYHIRYLLDVCLIKLVDQQVKGGNVEKYYRAVARIFDIRPDSVDVERDVALVKPVLDRVRAEMLASVMLFPTFDSYFHSRASQITEERMGEFNQRLLDLLAEFWTPDSNPPPDAERTRFSVFMYHDPGDLMHE